MKIVINQGMPKNTELFNPGCPLVAFGTSSVQKEKLGEVLKFGVQCGFRVLNMSDEHSNETSVGMSLKSLITGMQILHLRHAFLSQLLSSSEIYVLNKFTCKQYNIYLLKGPLCNMRNYLCFNFRWIHSQARPIHIIQVDENSKSQTVGKAHFKASGYKKLNLL